MTIMTTKQPQPPDRSACHQATVTIGGDDRDGTHYYVCSECNKPCDLSVAGQPPKQPDAELDDILDSLNVPNTLQNIAGARNRLLAWRDNYYFIMLYRQGMDTVAQGNSTRKKSLPVGDNYHQTSNLKQDFEQNLLDGDEVQAGQMLAATAVWDFISERLKLAETPPLSPNPSPSEGLVRATDVKKTDPISSDPYLSKIQQQVKAGTFSDYAAAFMAAFRPIDSKGGEFDSVSSAASEDEKELHHILLDYRSMVADIVQDSHDRGITTEQLLAVDLKAETAILAWHAHALERALNEQYNASSAMAYEDAATKAGSGNDVRRYAETRAAQLRGLTGHKATSTEGEEIK